ncbi:ABC transporter permease [Paracoccus suum]|uniref:ABC transporter permease n=1 Tax=Paracoccus suum TaxID=2259340 RepID=A0A344PHZ3_9RHOB|nr:ABC transporter permease [Paracoccus suum]AXC48998.1 ABC transporter permease [Paracoccus suum]
MRARAAAPAWWRSTEAMVGGILLLAMVLIGLVNPAFWSPDNLFSLLRSNVVIGIMALGVLVVMISGGIDVSFTAFAVAGMYLVVRAMVAWGIDSVFAAFAAATLIGALLGLVNASIIHRLRMIPLIVTLGTASIVRGLVLGLVGTSNVNINKFPKPLIAFGRTDLVTLTNAQGATFGLPATLLIYLGVALALHLVLTRTMIGRSVFAYGASPEAAQRVGFRTGRTLIFVYVLAGALAGMAGLLHSSMIWLANPRDFVGWELDVIAAVVLGGASIFGGRGSVLGTLLGVFIIVMIKNSLILMGIDTTWQRVVVGAMLIGATALTALRDRKALA